MIFTEIAIFTILILAAASMYSILSRDPHDFSHVLGLSVYITDFKHLSLIARTEVVVLALMTAGTMASVFATSNLILKQIKSL